MDKEVVILQILFVSETSRELKGFGAQDFDGISE